MGRSSGRAWPRTTDTIRWVAAAPSSNHHSLSFCLCILSECMLLLPHTWNYNPRWELRPPDPHSSDRTRPWHIKLRPLHCKIAAQFHMVLTDYDPNATLAVHKKFPTRQKERRKIISKNATWFSVMPNLQAATSTWTQSILHGSLLETFAKRRGFPPPSGTTRRSIWLPSPKSISHEEQIVDIGQLATVAPC